MKRILFTTPNFVTAGSGLVVLDLLRTLDRTTFEPLVCVGRRGGLDVEIEALGVPIIEQPFTVSIRPWHSAPRRLWQAAQPFRHLHVDVWHSWHYSGDFSEVLVARLAGARRWIYTKKNLSWGGLDWRLRSLLADCIVINNPRMQARFFSAPLYRGKVRPIPQGVNTQHFQAQLSSGLRARLGLPPNALLVGSVGNLVPNKDQATLLRSVSLARSRPYVLLVGRGDPDYIASLRKLAGELFITQQVFFIGAMPNAELPALLSELNVFVLASHNEGLPVALLEAMACERACIAAINDGSIAVIHDGQDGLLFPAGDAPALAKALDRLSEQPETCRQMGQRARQTVLAGFTFEQQAAGYDRLYRELCGLPEVIRERIA